MDPASALREFEHALEARTILPAQLPAWHALAVHHLHPGETLRIFSVHKDRELVALLPLVRRKGSSPFLEIAGANVLYEPNDASYRDQDALDVLTEGLSRCGEPVRLDRIPATSPTVASLQRSMRAHGFLFIRETAPSPWLSLSEGGPLAQPNARRRQDLRRARRRADERGGFTSEILSPQPSEVPGLLALAFEIEAASWKGRQGTALAQDPLRAPFYRALAEESARAGHLRMCFGRVGEKPCAMQIALQLGGAFWLLKIGYDPEYSRCSPGQLLIEDSIRYAAGTGANAFEFLGSVEPWTGMWTNDVRQYVTVFLFPWNMRGLLALGREAVAKAGGRLLRPGRGG